MYRRDFLKIAFAALLAACAPKGKPAMLPNSTNRYGDMLKDLFSGVPGVDQTKLEILQRNFNELSDREAIYKSWLGPDKVATFPDMRARKGLFDISPINGAYYGSDGIIGGGYPQTLSSSAVYATVTGYPNTAYHPTSCFQWYDQTNGYFEINPIMSEPISKSIYLVGSVQWQSPSTSGVLNLVIKKKSDGTTVNTMSVAADFASADQGGFDHPFFVAIPLFVFTSYNVRDLYFYFQTKCTFASGTRGIAVSFNAFKVV